MAQLVVGLAGAAIGSAFGAPGIGWAIGASIGGMLGPRQRAEGPRLSDLKVTAAEYGAPIPVIYGHPRTAGVAVWASDKREIATTTRQGKGGGPESTSYTYEVDVLYLLSANLIAGVRRIWANGKLVYSVAAESDGETVEASEDTTTWRALRVYTGADGQLPDPTYEAAVGVGNATAYRGRGSIMLEGVQLGSGGQLPNFTFEIGTGEAPTAVQRVWQFPAEGAYVGMPAHGAALGLPRSALLAAPDGLRLERDGAPTVTTPAPPGAMLSEPGSGSTSTSAPAVVLGDIGSAPLMYVCADGSVGVLDLLAERDWVGTSDIRYSVGAGLVATSCAAALGSGADSYDGCLGSLGRIYLWGRPGLSRVATIEHGRAVSSLAVTSDEVYALSGAEVYRYSAAGVLLESFAVAPGVAPAIYPSPEGLLMCANQAGDIYLRDAGAWGQVGQMVYGADAVDLGTSTSTYAVRGSAVVAVRERDVISSMPGWRLRWRNFIGTEEPGYDSLGQCVEKWLETWSGQFTNVAGGHRATRAALAKLIRIDTISTDGFWRARAFYDVSIERLYGYPGDTQNGWYRLDYEAQFDQYEDEYFPLGLPVAHVEYYELSRVGRAAADPVPLADVVIDLCARCGVLAADIDVASLVGQQVHAIAVQPTSARAVLEQLATAYYFECVESDRLYFRRRGAAPVATIPYGDYGADGLLTLQDANDLELPAQVNVSYLNLSNAYQQGNEVSDRITTESTAVSGVQLGMGLTPDVAKAIADTAVLDQTVAARTGSATLDVRYARLEPTDAVMLQDSAGLQHRARIVKIADADGVRSLDVVADDARVLRELGITSDDYDDDYTVMPLADTDLVILDIPLLRDQDDNAGLYAAGDALQGRWPGYLLLRDGTEVGRSSAGAAMGVVAEALGNWASLLVDESNIITVNVNPGDELVSITHADLSVSTSNYAAIGAPGRWEIVQYQRAVLVSEGVYRVSGLARGRLGTEHLRGTHQAGDRFVALDGAGLLRDVGNVGDMGLPRTYTAVTQGARVDDGTAVTASPTWQGLRPLSPVGARQLKQGNGDIVLQWGRRSRYVSNVLMGVLPLGEAAEAYELDVLNGSTVVRTLASSMPAATYTAAQQVADFGAQQAAVSARIYQLSASIGRGQPAGL